jgi:hypothetical protein
MKIIITEEDGVIGGAMIVSGAGILLVLAEIELVGRCLALRKLHVHGVDINRNSLGTAGIRHIVQEAMEELGVDEITIEGAHRTSGAGPGRAPRALRFARKISPEERADDD